VAGTPSETNPLTWDLGQLLRRGAAVASAAAALLHFSAAADHGALPAQMLLFVAAAVLQMLWASAAVGGFSPGLVVAGVIGNAVFVGAWMLSRTWGLGFVLGSGHEAPEPIGFKDTATVLLEIAVITAVVLFALLPESGRRISLPAGRAAFSGTASATALVLAFALTQYPSGGGHEAHHASFGGLVPHEAGEGGHGAVTATGGGTLAADAGGHGAHAPPRGDRHHGDRTSPGHDASHTDAHRPLAAVPGHRGTTGGSMLGHAHAPVAAEEPQHRAAVSSAAGEPHGHPSGEQRGGHGGQGRDEGEHPPERHSPSPAEQPAEYLVRVVETLIRGLGTVPVTVVGA
jgi:hypothetical protein